MEVREHYGAGIERDRLGAGVGRLEAERTLELLARWLPPAPAVVLDVGGGAGRHALPLAALGFHVHLVDPVPLHVQQAAEASAAAEHPLASVAAGEARDLAFPDASADAVLLLGPLYHLTDAGDRLSALREARRVVRPGGVIVAAGISRWASTLDGFRRGFLRDAEFARIVADDVATGVHHNPTRHPDWFTTAYFHRPDELAGEVRAAGFAVDGPVAVEGLAGLAPDIEAMLDDPEVRARVLEALRRTEREPALIGVSSHFLVAGRRQG
jgi:SAM-dependent methyltransferase